MFSKSSMFEENQNEHLRVHLDLLINASQQHTFFSSNEISLIRAQMGGTEME